MLCNISAYAAEMRASSQISLYSATLAKRSNGDLRLTYYIVATKTMDDIGASKVVVERYSGTRWVTEHTYSIKDTPELQTNEAKQYSNNLTFTPIYSGSDYRVTVTFYVKDSSGSSTKVVTTNTVTV
jgi:hypothetical protein